MRWDDVYISSCATVLGQRERTADAVAQGRYDAADREADGYESVCVAGAGPAMDMAVQAARRALARSAVNSEDVRLLLHASCGPQGPAHVAAASYIQGHTVGGTGCSLEIKQFSNGGMAALQLGACYLVAESSRAAVLLTTGDKFRQPTIDRYRCDPGNVLGDGATGLVLSRCGGVARLLSTVVIGDGSFSDFNVGGITRGGPEHADFLAEHGARLIGMVGSMSLLQAQSVELALRDAGTDAADISRWVCSHVGQTQVDQQFRKTMGIEEADTTWEWGRTVGHLGAGDQIAGLNRLLETGALRAGERVALCGMGTGFTYSCAIVEILGVPTWVTEVLD